MSASDSTVAASCGGEMDVEMEEGGGGRCSDGFLSG